MRGTEYRGTLLAGAIAVAAFSVATQVAPAADDIRHVVIIGVDGLSPDGLAKADTPNIDGLVKRGAHTFRARGVMPTSSSPNWASMIMGAGPEQHGVTSNDWRADKHDIPPILKGAGGIFPTVFQVLREQRPDSVIAVIHHWDGFANLYERTAVDVNENPKSQSETAARAIALFREKRPTLTFVHMDHVDAAGHEHGHGTPPYYRAVEEADRLTGRLLDGLRDAGMLDHSLILLTSDHGGKGKGHGGATLEEIEIPWIVAGPGVAAGRRIDEPVNTYDTAATIAWALRLKPPQAWLGRPVLAAFQRQVPSPGQTGEPSARAEAP